MIHKRLHHVGIILPKEEYVRELMDMYGLESEMRRNDLWMQETD